MNSGFSLVELILAVFLSAMIVAGLSSFQGGIGRDKGRIVQEISVQTQADYARKVILRELAEATVVQSPPYNSTQDVSCNELIGWKNLRVAYVTPTSASTIVCGNACGSTCEPKKLPPDGSAMAKVWIEQNWVSIIDKNKDGTIIKGNDVSYFRICLTNDKQLYYYWGPGYLVPSGGCGSPGFNGIGHGTVLLAGEPKGTVTVNPTSGKIFSRPFTQYNTVGFGFTVDYAAGKFLDKASAKAVSGVELLLATR